MLIFECMYNPDNYLRKYFMTQLNNMVVNGKTIKVYDSHTPNNESNVIILSAQTSSNDWENKCGVTKNCIIEIQVLTKYSGQNTGNRQMLDDIIEEIQTRCQNIVIDNFTVEDWNFRISNDFITSNTTETIYRKILNYNLKIK